MIAKIRKAIMAAGFTAAGSLGAMLLDGSLTTSEALYALGTGLVAGAGTWAVPNARQ